MAQEIRSIPVSQIIPSPFQQREYFDQDTLKELAQSITIDGLLFPILVRPVGPPACQSNAGTSRKQTPASRAGEHFELIAGERRFRAIRDYTDMQTIEAMVVERDDIGARRASDAENVQREDLTVFETIRSTVELVDSELSGDDKYDSMGPNSVDRVKALLGKMDAVRRSDRRGSAVSDTAGKLSHKFVGQVEQIFKRLAKPLEWRSFYVHDLNLLVETDQRREVRKSAVGRQRSERDGLRSAAGSRRMARMKN